MVFNSGFAEVIRGPLFFLHFFFAVPSEGMDLWKVLTALPADSNFVYNSFKDVYMYYRWRRGGLGR